MKTAPSLLKYAAIVLFSLFCMVTEAAPPADIQRFFQTIEQEEINYPDRASDVAAMIRYYKSGEFDLVRFKAKQIIEKQRNVKTTKGGKMPADIQRFFQTIDKEEINYPDRASDVAAMIRYYKSGEFDLVRFKAKQIIEKQRNVKTTKGGKIPADIQRALQTIDREEINYPDRASDVGAMIRYFKSGEFDLVRFKAKQIIEKQRNVRRSR